MSEQDDVLKELEQQFQTDPTLANAGTNRAPVGNAVLRVTNAYMNRSQKGRKQMVWACEVLEHDDPTGAGSSIPVRFGCENIKDMKRLNTSLVNCDVAPIAGVNDFSRVIREVQENDGMVFAAKLAENDDPQFPPNVYINPGARRRDKEKGPQGGPAAAPSGDRF